MSQITPEEALRNYAKLTKQIDAVLYWLTSEHAFALLAELSQLRAELDCWRWTTRMGLVVQEMASESDGPKWAVLDVDSDALGYGETPMEAIKAAKKEVEGE